MPYFAEQVHSRLETNGAYYTVHAVDESGKPAFSAVVFQPIHGAPTVASSSDSPGVSDEEVLAVYTAWSALPGAN